jgi:hypothetical protein
MVLDSLKNFHNLGHIRYLYSRSLRKYLGNRLIGALDSLPIRFTP